MQIFSESCRIALKTKHSDIAQERYELVVETFHQLQVMVTDQDARDSVRDSMFTFLELYPIQVVFREVNLHRNKAARLKTVSKRIGSLREATQVLERAVTYAPRCREFHAALAQVRAELGALETAPR